MPESLVGIIPDNTVGKKTITIARGEQKIFEIDLRQENGRPFDLTSWDKFRVAIPIGSGDFVSANEVATPSGSVVAVSGESVLGILQVTLSTAATAALVAGERLALDVELGKTAFGTDILRERFPDAINVVDFLG